MILNNTLYFGGAAALLFHGNTAYPQGLKHYLVMQSVVFSAWGIVNVFGRGFHQLGTIIESGELDTYLGTPKSALLLAGISRSDLGSFGDMIQGFLMCIGLGFFFSVGTSFGILAATIIAVSSILSLFILSGAVALFFARSSTVQDLIVQACMICVGWPISPKLEGYERILVYITPLVGISFLNVEAVIDARPSTWIAALAGSLGFLGLSLLAFRRGLRSYQSGSVIQMR